METIKEFFNQDNIYLIANLGVIPLWLMLIFLPSSRFVNIFINTIFLPIILAFTYGYLLYQEFYTGGMFTSDTSTKIVENFKLYASLDQLGTLLSNKTFLLTFWIHFLTISIFTGTWIAKDAVRNGIHKYVVILPLILTYFTGPLGLFLYLFLRMIIIQKLKIND